MEENQSPAAFEKRVAAIESRLDEALAPRKEKAAKKKKAGSARGVETMFRNVYRVHTDLSSLADQKANFLMTINGVVMAVVIGTNGIAFTSDSTLLLPTILVLMSAVASMIFAILAARPRITANTLSVDDAKKDRGNLLFFGNFVSLKEEEFTEAMMGLLDDNQKVYPVMIRDLYGLGLVLRKKFDRLRVAYTIILIGLPLGVSSFVVIHLWRVVAPHTAP